MDRKKHWESVYSDKSPIEVSWYQAEPTLSLELIHKTELPKEALIIDVGGGASVLVDRLYDEGFHNIAVLDISAKALAYAKERLRENAEKIEWFESDIADFSAPHQYDLWHDRAIFHFLTGATDRRKYVEVLSRTLKSGGHLILAAFAIGGPEKCSGLDIVQYDSEKLQAELGESFMLMEESEEIHVTPANKKQKFALFRYIKEA